jgi:spore coat polysaccharide biosynthesis protein SpsF
MFKDKNQKIIATIEARMTSSRLPGKVLMPLGGVPALELLIKRLQRSKYIDEIVVATTINPDDEPVVNCAENNGAKAFRGSEEDVLLRVLDAAKSVEGDIIVEITGDCPFVDPVIVDQTIEAFYSNDVDYVSNVLPVTFPIGFDSQVFPVSVLAEVDKKTDDPIDRVHVSYYIYTHKDEYKCMNVPADEAHHWPELHVTLDEEDDYKLLDEIAKRLLPEKPEFTALDVITLLKENPDLFKINEHVRRKEAQDG